MKKWITFALVASSFSGHLFAQNEVIEQPIINTRAVETPVLIDEDLILERKSNPNDFYLEEPPRVFELDIEEDFIEYEASSQPQNLGEPDLSKLENGRILDELNDVEGTDAYPFLSKDGLRLYWTQSEGGDHLVMASRADIYSDFSTAKNLEFDFEIGEVMSCWLSADELIIYFKDAGVLTKASRSDLNAAFSNPEKISLNFNGEYGGFFSAPSLTQDENQLFLYQSLNGQRIVQLERTANNEFTEVGILEVEGETEPGQISHDGLSYSLTVEGGNQLIVFKRDHLDDDFNHKEYIDLGGSFHQVTHNEQIMILGFSADDSWGSNELYIAKHPQAKEEEVVAEEPIEEVIVPQTEEGNIGDNALYVTTLDIFPNPAEQFVNLRFNLPEGSQKAQLDILDLKGKLIRSQRVQDLGQVVIQLDVNDLASGTYICRLTAKGVAAISKALVIK